MRHFTLFIFLFIMIFSGCISLNAQHNRIEILGEKVTKFNDALQYEKSIQLLSDFIADTNTTSYEKYKAYLYKSYTYKRLFNYEETLNNLDLALHEGLNSDKKEEVENVIKAEKAFVYFDTHNYQKASPLMSELAKTNYQYLDNDVKSFIIMQEGYLLMKQKKYPEAEQKLNESLAITLKYTPRNAPNIFGKKIELDNEMKLYGKRDEDFNEGMKYAKKYKIIKYEMYLHEVMRNQFQNNKDYKSAFNAQKKYDSLQKIYNAANNNGKIQILEKQIDQKQTEIENQKERNVRYSLIGLISLLSLLLITSFFLYKTLKEKKILVENENTRINNEIKRLTQNIGEEGNKKRDLSKFNLSERQKQIIEMLQKEKSNKEIADKLCISENTVKYHLKIIYETLNIENRTQFYS